MTSNEVLLNIIPILTRSLNKKRFNLFDVMRHGTDEKQLSNIFAWLLTAGQSHELGDSFIRLFLDEINNDLDEPIALEPFTVLQEVNTASLDAEMDIADIVLEGDKTVIVIENYYSSSGHGHCYDGYYSYGASNSKRSVVVLLCEIVDSSLQTAGWEQACVVSYSDLIKKLYSLVESDANYQKAFPLQYGFIIQMEDYFVKTKKINDDNLIDFINVLFASGEGESFRKNNAAKAASDLGEFFKEETINLYNESREMLNRVKSELRRFANTTLKQQINTETTVFDNVCIEYQGIYQWTINLKKASEIVIQIKFGPSAWFANEKDDAWKVKVVNADYSHLFLTNNQTQEIRQSEVTLSEVLEGLAPDNTKLCEEFIQLIAGC